MCPFWIDDVSMLMRVGVVVVQDFPLKDETIVRFKSGPLATLVFFARLSPANTDPGSHDRRPDLRGSNTWESHGRPHFS
jgi:hypothetical protein